MNPASNIRPGRPAITAAARFLAVAIALVAVTATVVIRSDSAFSGTTGNSGNQLVTGSVVLTDNDSGSALFNATGLVPGTATTTCIEVTYQGSLTPASPIKLYGGYVDGPDANSTADSTLAPYLDLKIDIGTAGQSCASFNANTTIFDTTNPSASAGTMSTFTTAYAAWASGLSTGWTPTGGSNAMRPFRITATLQNDNNAQAKIAEPSFTWEARSA